MGKPTTTAVRTSSKGKKGEALKGERVMDLRARFSECGTGPRCTAIQLRSNVFHLVRLFFGPMPSL